MHAKDVDLWSRRLGGMTGDVFSAALELAAAGVLLTPAPAGAG
jgi:hypothetical protein